MQHSSKSMDNDDINCDNEVSSGNDIADGGNEVVSAVGLIGSNFIRKLYEICSDGQFNAIIRWTTGETAIV